MEEIMKKGSNSKIINTDWYCDLEESIDSKELWDSENKDYLDEDFEDVNDDIENDSDNDEVADEKNKKDTKAKKNSNKKSKGKDKLNKVSWLKTKMDKVKSMFDKKALSNNSNSKYIKDILDKAKSNNRMLVDVVNKFNSLEAQIKCLKINELNETIEANESKTVLPVEPIKSSFTFDGSIIKIPEGITELDSIDNPSIKKCTIYPNLIAEFWREFMLLHLSTFTNELRTHLSNKITINQKTFSYHVSRVLNKYFGNKFENGRKSGKWIRFNGLSKPEDMINLIKAYNIFHNNNGFEGYKQNEQMRLDIHKLLLPLIVMTVEGVLMCKYLFNEDDVNKAYKTIMNDFGISIEE